MRLCLLILFLSFSIEAGAAWLDWWKRADQQGFELLNNGQIEQAGETFSSSDWRGSAKFLGGDFSGAVDEFSRSDSIDAIYNRATALAHAGEFEQSLAAFDHLLKRQSTHADGIVNRDWVLRQLQQQQQQNSQQQNQQGDSSDSEQQSGESQREEGDQQGDSQQQSADENRDGEQSEPESANATHEDQQDAGEQSLKSALENQIAGEQIEPLQQEMQQQQTNTGMEQPAYDEVSQAIEQQLQRIPDDPAGLLRNKLHVTHRARYPEIREGSQPW